MDEGLNEKIWSEWEKGKNYQKQMGFEDIFPQCIDFKEGRQWGKPGKDSAHMPRPVFNICNKFVATKRANILSQTVKLVYTPAEGDTETNEESQLGAKLYSDFATNLWKEIHQDDLNEEYVDDSATLGTGILHYFWDTSVTGGHKYRYVGALRGEVLDPLCVVFGNPLERDVQKQPYIIIGERRTVEEVREYARNEGVDESLIANIVGDDDRPDNYQASKIEQSNKKYCTVLTRYSKDNGVVRDTCTKDVMIVEHRSLTPNENSESKFDLYPIVVFPWNLRKRSIYGLGEVETNIPTQKTINWLYAVNTLSAQDNGICKWLVKRDALRQDITNKPGEIIVDHWGGQGSGIQQLKTEGVSSGTISLADKMLELAQYSDGVNEVVSGEPFTANIPASSLIALQNQAKIPIENIQKRFYRTIEQVGRIWEQFFKFYYDFMLPLATEVIDEQGNSRQKTIAFLGSAFSEIDFNLDVDVGAGSAYSESLAQASLENLLNGNYIDVEDYVELSPKNVMPFKEDLLKRLQQRKIQQMMGGGLPEGNGIEPTEEGSGRAPLGIELPKIPEQGRVEV